MRAYKRAESVRAGRCFYSSLRCGVTVAIPNAWEIFIMRVFNVMMSFILTIFLSLCQQFSLKVLNNRMARKMSRP
jgi:hypothetical protein